jgi:3-oxoacyl-[acyl-carrier protein] reductase
MNKTLIITGAGKGIGFETALLLAKEGCTVVAVSRNAASLQQLVEKSNGAVLAFPFDLTTGNADDLIAFLQSKDIYNIDGLINNAGLLIKKPFEEITAEDLKACYEVNVFAPYLLVQKLLPLLKRSVVAHVVNISSMGGFQGAQKFAGLSVYSSSKAALVGITECLAEELKNTTVKVNCLCLGAVQTEMLAEAFPGYQAPVSAADMASFIAAFTLKNHLMMNGRIIPVALSTP